MSSVDDQIASMLAAAGAADVLERRVASQRDRARAVLRRQSERIARLEQLLLSLRDGPAPPASAAPPAPNTQELSGLVRELLRRQQQAEQQAEQHQQQLLAALATPRELSLPTAAELAAPLQQSLAEFRQQYLAAMQQETEQRAASLAELAERLAGHAGQVETRIDQQSEGLAELRRLLADPPTATNSGHDNDPQRTSEQLEAWLQSVTDRLLQAEQQRLERDAELRGMIAQLQQQLSEVPGSAPAGAAADSGLVLQALESQRQAAEQQRGELAQQLDALHQLGDQIAETLRAAPAEPAMAGIVEQLNTRLAQQAATIAQQESTLRELLEAMHQQHELLVARADDSESHQRLAELAQLQQQLYERLEEQVHTHFEQQSEAVAQRQADSLDATSKQLEALRRQLEQSLAAPLQEAVATLVQRLDTHHQQHVENSKKLAAALAKLHPREALASHQAQVEIASAVRGLAEQQARAEAAREQDAQRQTQLLSQLAAQLAGVQDQALDPAALDRHTQQLHDTLAQLGALVQQQQTSVDAHWAELTGQLELLAEQAAQGPQATDQVLQRVTAGQATLEKRLDQLTDRHTEQLSGLAEQLTAQAGSLAAPAWLTDLQQQLRQQFADSREAARLQDATLGELADRLSGSSRDAAAASEATRAAVAEQLAEHRQSTERAWEAVIARWETAAAQRDERLGEQARLLNELRAHLATSHSAGDEAASAELLTSLLNEIQAISDCQRAHDKQLTSVLEQLQTRPADNTAAASKALVQELLTAQHVAAQQTADLHASYEASAAGYKANLHELQQQVAELRSVLAADQPQLLAQISRQLEEQEKQRTEREAQLQQQLASLLAAQVARPSDSDGAERSGQLQAALEQLLASQRAGDEGRTAELAELRQLLCGLEQELRRTPASEPLAAMTRQLDELSTLVREAARPAAEDASRILLEQLSEQLRSAEQQRQADQQQLAAIVAQLAERQVGASGGEGEAAGNMAQLIEQFADQQREAETRQAEAQRQLARSLSALQSQLEELAESVRGQAAAAPLTLARSEPRAARGSAPKETTISPSLGWEEAKQRLLAQLEAEGEEGSEGGGAPAAAGDEQPGEWTPTLEASPLQEAEIAELRRQLEMYQQAAEATNAVDKDELVVQERDRLRQLQEEWQEKLRKAEIDISIERAKLARERTRLEEQLQTLQQGRSENAADDPTGKAGKNRWLARLGLLEEER